MKNEIKSRTLIGSLLILASLLCLPSSAYANSSWHWFTKQPWTILPLVVVITLLIEVGIICFSNRMKPRFIPLISIVAANVLSFLFPLFALGILPVLGMENEPFLSE